MHHSLADNLQPFFDKYRALLAAVYLFGSVALDQATAQSDLDIAVLLTSTAVDAAASLRFSLFADCSRILKRNDIDLIILNTAANLILQDAIIRTGILLYDGDSTARVDYELNVLHQAADFRWQRQMAMGV